MAVVAGWLWPFWYSMRHFSQEYHIFLEAVQNIDWFKVFFSKLLGFEAQNAARDVQLDFLVKPWLKCKIKDINDNVLYSVFISS